MSWMGKWRKILKTEFDYIGNGLLNDPFLES